ncbi:TrlF family AAA-like ATPase [Tardiphaga sp. 20_F10_N6_6]|uniref:TrlF family AAA-like ATPase n=1 Tax=Tardiphaga sp. 20_F10_N6_6 TaxID=3240788 RepID=UPI003F8CDCBD
MVKRGSEWHRWEPHIHAPGTILNDGYTGAGAWDAFLSALESAQPPIRAIGLTDYCSIETYKLLRAAKDRDGRLKDCEVVFPNVELRLDVGTKKGNQVNIHLLVNPDAENHIEELERFLGRLKFSAHEDEFACTRADLIRLGRKHDPKVKLDAEALAVGVNQFKISQKELLEQHEAIGWAKENILIAVAGGADGTSGVQEAADAIVREEIEKGAHAIFASSPKQREFWLGRGKQSGEAIRQRYGSLKPCLWGCDAHELSKVAKPDNDRFCWIKGLPRFDTLKQACIDPARAFVGDAAPSWAAPSQVISDVIITEGEWALTPHIQLNPGFVAIIGARGSGKTALADMIAAGCDAYDESEERPSFLERAREHLGETSVELRWLDGRQTEPRVLADPIDQSSDVFPRARYLSQQFVEKICGIDGMPELVREIERVIFEAHSEIERDGAYDFEELRELKSSIFREARSDEEDALQDVSDQIGIELEKNRQLASLKRQAADKKKLLAQYNADKKSLMPKAPSKHADRLQVIEAAAIKAQQNLRVWVNRQQALTGINNEVGNFRTNEAPSSLRSMKSRNQNLGFDDDSWKPFLLEFSGDVDAVIQAKLKEAERIANGWRGVKPREPADSDASFILADADLARQPLALLEAEKQRLQRLVAADTETLKRLAAITKKISEETIILESLNERISDSEGAKARAKTLVAEREAGYGRVFDAILAEEVILNELYSPLMSRLTGAAGSLAKLSFSVTRVADHEKWANRGEDELFDLRGGPFKGIGSLAKISGAVLRPVWETGSAEDVATAMQGFRDEYEETLLANAPMSKAADPEHYRAWTRRFAQWLYGTDHITIRYGILYDGVDIRKLSPGTRGIVVLLLYLALDQNEVCPLIIDQPEENLDPKSIFDELVPLFEDAKLRRQVIMVTHNANLVINANADQIIIARSGSHTADGLPPISYNGGGLEEADVRERVSEILEGGKEAFKERARRLRISFSR